MDEILKYQDVAIDLVVKYGPNLVYAFLTFIIGLWIIKILMGGFTKLMTKRNFEPTLASWLRAFLSAVLKIILIITALSMVGIEMTSFIAILGAAGLAIGLALQGTLQNFAGGIIILLFKPYKVGDFIDGAGYMGTVKEIQIFNTVLNTPDNKIIIIPNGPLATGSLINFSKEDNRRVDWTFGISYGDDFDKAKEVLTQLIKADNRIKSDPEPFIALHALADSSVNIVVRVWVNIADYWPVFFDMNEKVYKTFPKENLNIPFPQMDVHVHQTNKG